MVKPIVPVALLSIAVLTNAHAHGEQRRHDIHARQNPPPGQPSASANPSVPASSAGSASSGKPSLTFSLATSNPTAIPLASITGGASQRQTLALASTVQADAVPTLIVGAPPLPDRLALNPLDYPTGDQIPPTDSREVDIWWDEIVNSGVQIPDFEPTHPAVPPQGNCEGANAAFAADPNRCWWTCGGCVTVDDIDECNDKNHWGLTFDDGPANYTSNLLHYLDEVQLKATFFVVGSRVTAFPATLQAQYAGGHQIGIHTWSHKALTTLSNREIVAELGWTKKVIYDTLGVTPNMMRPPYGDIDNRVRAISLAMGLTPVMWTRAEGQVFNTEDFDINGGKPVETILNKWQSILSTIPLLNKGFITLQHDLYQEFVDMATGYIIPGGLAVNPRLTIEPVSTCTGRRLADAYIETNDNSSFPLKARLGVHTPGGPADRGSGDRVVASAVAAFSLVGATGLLAGWLL